MDLASQLRSSFGVKALTALERAAARSGPNRPVDTLGVFLALAETDAAARWDRIWLEFGELDPSAAGRHSDPLPEAVERWNGQPVTATCGTAIRAAVMLANGSGLIPVPAGVLALCLVGEPATAASRALAATSEHAHSALLKLVQEALIGGSWQDIKSVLKQCFNLASAAAPSRAPSIAAAALGDQDPDVQRFLDDMADRFEALLDVLNQFLRADTPAESGMLLEQHPELLGAQIDKVIAKALKDAAQAGDEAGVERLRERRSYLDNYRRLIGTTLPEDTAIERYGECQPRSHIMTHSIVEEPNYTSTAIRCDLCHVGCLVDMTAGEDGVLHADVFVFPADGCDTISPEMTMWAVAACEGSLSELEDHGIPVRRSAPVIGMRPESLHRHTRFTRDS